MYALSDFQDKKLEAKMKRKWRLFTRKPSPNQDYFRKWEKVIKSVFGVTISVEK